MLDCLHHQTYYDEDDQCRCLACDEPLPDDDTDDYSDPYDVMWQCHRCGTTFDEKGARCFGWRCDTCDVPLKFVGTDPDPEKIIKPPQKSVTMKTLTLWQPYASLIAVKAKTIETRPWQTKFRGIIAIHSAKKWTREEVSMTAHFRHKYKSARRLPDELPLGCIVAAVELTDIVPVEQVRDTLPDDERAYGNYADARYAWKLKWLKVPETPIPAVGKQGLWEWTYP